VRQAFIATAPPIAQTLTQVAAMIDAGQIKPTVSIILPLREIQIAHEMTERRHTMGKLVLKVVN
jgi:NADPH:quinone reductase-like Zn-dependent oxidoreductase